MPRYTIHTEPGHDGFIVTAQYDGQPPEVTSFPSLDDALSFIRGRLMHFDA